jgi:tetratricopeptide (TPR) repeat protein
MRRRLDELCDTIVRLTGTVKTGDVESPTSKPLRIKSTTKAAFISALLVVAALSAWFGLHRYLSFKAGTRQAKNETQSVKSQPPLRPMTLSAPTEPIAAAVPQPLLKKPASRGVAQSSTPTMTAQSRNLDQDVALARQYLKAGQFDNALSEFRIVSKDDPQTAKWHSCIGSLSAALGQFEEAEAEFKQAGSYEDAAKIKVNLGTLKKAIRFSEGSEVTEEVWAEYLTLSGNAIPGTHPLLERIEDQVYVQRDTGPNTEKWVSRSYDIMSHPGGGMMAGCY